MSSNEKDARRDEKRTFINTSRVYSEKVVGFVGGFFPVGEGEETFEIYEVICEK